MGAAIDSLFRNLENLDPECRERFAAWFSHHLTNFDLKWAWEHWEYVLENENSAKFQAKWLREVLERVVRLLYFERVMKVIPEKFHRFMPTKPVFNFPYEGNFQIEFKLKKRICRDFFSEIW